MKGTEINKYSTIGPVGNVRSLLKSDINNEIITSYTQTDDYLILLTGR